MIAADCGVGLFSFQLLNERFTASSFLSSGDGHLSREEAATRGYEVANALRIAMSALDPRREVFRRRSSKNPPQHTGATFAARDSRRLS